MNFKTGLAAGKAFGAKWFGKAGAGITKKESIKVAASAIKKNLKQTTSEGMGAKVLNAFSKESIRKEALYGPTMGAYRFGSWSSGGLAKAGKFIAKGIGYTGVGIGRTLGSKPSLAVGAVAMLGINVMKGGMNQARDVVQERYMQDYTYSKSMLHNTRIGNSSGTSSMLKRDGTQGLSLALSRSKHGR